ERRRKKQRVGAVLLSLACLSMGSTAWAAATGRLPAVWRLVAGAFQHESREASPAIAPRATTRPISVPPVAIAPPPAVVPPTAPPLPAPDKEKAVRAGAQRPRRPAPTVPAATVPAQAQAQAQASDPQDTLFKAAYHAHFVARDPSAALDGWDRYLATAPDGRY